MMHTNPMLIEDLRDWLNEDNPDYALGVKIFYEITAKVHTRESLLKFKDATKLKNLMEKLWNDIAGGKNDSKVEKSEDIIANAPKAIAKIEDDTTQKIQDEIILLYKELNVVHSKLLEEATESGRLEVAKKVLKIDSDIRDLQDDLVYYRIHGKLPTRTGLPKNGNLSEEQAKMKLEYKNISPRIYQEKKLIHSFEVKMGKSNKIEEIQKWQKKIKDKQAKIEELKQLKKDLTQKIKMIKDEE